MTSVSSLFTTLKNSAATLFKPHTGYFSFDQLYPQLAQYVSNFVLTEMLPYLVDVHSYIIL
jgi:hypothetical protein